MIRLMDPKVYFPLSLLLLLESAHRSAILQISSNACPAEFKLKPQPVQQLSFQELSPLSIHKFPLAVINTQTRKSSHRELNSLPQTLQKGSAGLPSGSFGPRHTDAAAAAEEEQRVQHVRGAQHNSASQPAEISGRGAANTAFQTLFRLGSHAFVWHCLPARLKGPPDPAHLSSPGQLQCPETFCK